MLNNDYEILADSIQKKMEKATDFDQKVDSLMSILIRCKRIFEAKHEIIRILVKTKKRE
jgi:hypothetical protein